MSELLAIHALPSGSVMVSISSCESTELVESTRIECGWGGPGWHPVTFWYGSMLKSTCPISLKVTLPWYAQRRTTPGYRVNSIRRSGKQVSTPFGRNTWNSWP